VKNANLTGTLSTGARNGSQLLPQLLKSPPVSGAGICDAGLHAQEVSTPTTSLSEVLVRDIRVAGDIGVFAHEFGRVQALIVDVRLGIVPVRDDSLNSTIDYNDVVEHAMVLGRERIALIETFARRLAERCLTHPRVLEAEVQVKKPGALTNGVAAARVVLCRRMADVATKTGCVNTP
jgi:7,8-dihydroneopterin aldolase/epimerase/oxygenase